MSKLTISKFQPFQLEGLPHRTPRYPRSVPSWSPKCGRNGGQRWALTALRDESAMCRCPSGASDARFPQLRLRWELAPGTSGGFRMETHGNVCGSVGTLVTESGAHGDERPRLVSAVSLA